MDTSMSALPVFPEKLGLDAICERSPVRQRVYEGKKSETRRPRQSFNVTRVEMSQNRSVPNVRKIDFRL